MTEEDKIITQVRTKGVTLEVDPFTMDEKLRKQYQLYQQEERKTQPIPLKKFQVDIKFNNQEVAYFNFELTRKALQFNKNTAEPAYYDEKVMANVTLDSFIETLKQHLEKYKPLFETWLIYENINKEI